MADGEDYDGLEQAAGGDVRATAELIGATFTLIDFEEIQTRWEDEKTGNKRTTQIATLILEGEEEQLRYWLGGVQLNRQLSWVKTTGRLPMVMKLGGEGNQDSPYKLVAPGEETPLVEASKAAGGLVVERKGADALVGFRDKKGALDAKAFVGFWQDQGFGPDDLSEIIGPITASSLEHWFKTNKGKAVEDLLLIAEANRDNPEELPFE